MSSTGSLEIALGGIGKPFRDRILKSYIDLRAGFSKCQYDAAGLRAGVFAEAVARFLQQELTGSHTPFGTSLPNFADLCRSFERLDKAKGPESLRVIVPRALLLIYTLRNKRGIGHIGGDVEANEIDAATCMRTLTENKMTVTIVDIVGRSATIDEVIKRSQTLNALNGSAAYATLAALAWRGICHGHCRIFPRSR